jgi:hypothetical protein
MWTKRLMLRLVCVAAVSGCASAPPPPPPKPAPTIASLMGAAETAIMSGKNEEGVAILKTAIAAFPANKAPRLRIAQVQFDCHNYGEAIYHAHEVLERDPDDLMALSIAAVSGLRVSSKALGELAQKNNLTGPVRLEAQSLVRLLRANIGGELIPAVKPARPVVKPVTAQLPSAPKPTGGDTPADWLNK